LLFGPQASAKRNAQWVSRKPFVADYWLNMQRLQQRRYFLQTSTWKRKMFRKIFGAGDKLQRAVEELKVCSGPDDQPPSGANEGAVGK